MLPVLAVAQPNDQSKNTVPEQFNPANYVYVNRISADAPYHKANSGIVIVGDTMVRAMQSFSAGRESLERYARLANKLSDDFQDVQIYCMPIPLAEAFYMPTAARASKRNEHDEIRTMFAALNDDVEPVDIYPILGEHAAEPIYSRTDHHWAPLGAYYAAQQLAAAAGLPFRDLSGYDRHELEDYVGTMAKFSGDAAVSRSPETFVYYTPRDREYTTTYIDYKVKGYNVLSESGPEQGQFFIPFKGSSAYLTFMGGDYRLTKVETQAPNDRKLLIIKDSFGNAIPGYLFDTFKEIHVIDCRYFTKNLRKYIEDNEITDLVLANNIGHATTERTVNTILHYLEQ